MSGGDGGIGGRRRPDARVRLSILDRLLAFETGGDAPLTAGPAATLLRDSVRRDVEALLNARRPWRSLAPPFASLALSPLGFGLPDFTSGAFNDAARREELRRDVEDVLRRFEPRFARLTVKLLDRRNNASEGVLRLQIEALLLADPEPEPIAFQTMLDLATTDFLVRDTADV